MDNTQRTTNNAQLTYNNDRITKQIITQTTTRKENTYQTPNTTQQQSRNTQATTSDPHPHTKHNNKTYKKTKNATN